MTDTQKNALLGALIRPVVEAGHVIMDVYEGDIAVVTKDDQSPVTEADGRAEAVLLAAIERLTPDITTVAEEAASAGGLPAEAPDVFWLIDPLDGTKEFIKKRTDFTVNVALVEQGIPTLGLVYAPARNALFGGIVGEGAFTQDIAPLAGADLARALSNAVRTPIRVRTADLASLTVVASKSHRDDATNKYLERRGIRDIRSAGSSLKFCLLARGEADLYPRFGPTMEWDTAAGHAVLAAAGGAVFTPEGEPFIYGKPDFRNGGFIAVADPAVGV
ncbi:MAG: 3'(2'),5'-bisphosphate nucleotidase CysQ [Pseudomonadota bacterium]